MEAVGEGIIFFQAEDGIRDIGVTGVQTCALPISVDHDVGNLQLAEVQDAAHHVAVVLLDRSVAMQKVDGATQLFVRRENGLAFTDADRSEERRVGKERRSRWSPYH